LREEIYNSGGDLLLGRRFSNLRRRIQVFVHMFLPDKDL
jgi:hypothetical protein